MIAHGGGGGGDGDGIRFPGFSARFNFLGYCGKICRNDEQPEEGESLREKERKRERERERKRDFRRRNARLTTNAATSFVRWLFHARNDDNVSSTFS